MRINEIKKPLTEAKGPNTHIEHVEDLVFNAGYAGATEAIEYIDSVRRMLKPGSGEPGIVTVKYDGAPTIICGIDPSDGKFFVGTKSVFSKESKAIKKPSDVQKFYSDVPGLARKLAQAYKYLRQLGVGNIIQGDFMFDDEDKGRAIVDGKHMITFTPNTITYMVPLESALGKRINNAHFGIVFHTRYEGATLQTLVPTFGVNVDGLNHVESVWFDDANYKDLTGLATLTDDENTELIHKIEAAKSALAKTRPNKMNAVVFHKDIAAKFKPFINHLVRAGRRIDHPMGFVQQFVDYYNELETKALEVMKSGPDSVVYQKRQEKAKKSLQFIDDNLNSFLAIVAIYKNLIELKLDIIAKLRQVEGLGVFIKTKDGYQVSNHEGFVAIGREGNVVKLVDRMEFSRQNFNAVKSWKTE